MPACHRPALVSLLPAGLMQWPSKGVVVMFIFQTARWTDVPIQLKKRSYAGPPAKSRWDGAAAWHTWRRRTVRGSGSLPGDRPDWSNKQGRPMLIMKDMWLWMMHLPIKTCLCRLIYSPITCRVNNASCLHRPTRPGPRCHRRRPCRAAGSGPTRMLPASLPAGWAPKLRRAYCNHNCFLPCCSAITFISPLDADDPLSSFSYRGIHKWWPHQFFQKLFWCQRLMTPPFPPVSSFLTPYYSLSFFFLNVWPPSLENDDIIYEWPL